MLYKKIKQLTLLLIITKHFCYGLTYEWPENNIIGHNKIDNPKTGDYIQHFGRLYNCGANEMIIANPNINQWYLNETNNIIIPSQYIIPNVEKKNIVINVAEYRLYQFDKKKQVIRTFPIGIGRINQTTPEGNFKIIRKAYKPNWYPSKEMRARELANGKNLPKIVYPGKDNPLGDHALYLNIPMILLHGTFHHGGIGDRSSAGCIRLLPHDIETLYNNTNNGDSVKIIYQPIKIAIKQNKIFLETHKKLSDYKNTTLEEDLHFILHRILEENNNKPAKILYKQKITKMLETPNGIPSIIGIV